MESIFNVVFKKIIDLLGSELGSKLFRRKDKFLGKLLDLYHQLKLLDSSISHLASSLKWVLDDIEHNRLYYDEVCGTLNDIRDILGVIGEDLEALAPGLEIYAVDAVKAIESLKQIEDFYVNEAIPNDLVNLVAPLYSRTDNWQKWAPLLESVNRDATEASRSIADFIRENYTLEKFTQDTS